MDNEPGPSCRYDRNKKKKNDDHTSDSSSDSSLSPQNTKEKKSQEPMSSREPWIDNVDPSIRLVGHRVDLLNISDDKDSESLYERAKKMMTADEMRGDVRLPTTSEEYYDLEEMLLNPARMESGELTLNIYDDIRNSYNVLPGSHISETNFQKVIGCFSCDVCQEVIQHSIVNKKCGHRFCDQCILVALMRSGNTCPTCRQNLGSKRELQQDPRFDQLIDQVIESRTIVHRMMAENRDHEKDIYFGRYGYIEGERDWNKRYGIVGEPENKVEKELLRGEKQNVPWFDDEGEDGAVPKMLYGPVTMRKLKRDTSEARLRALDGLPRATPEQISSVKRPKKNSRTVMIDGIEITCLSSDDNEDNDSEDDSDDSDDSESETEDSEEADSELDSEDDSSESSEESEGSENSDVEEVQPKTRTTKKNSTDTSNVRKETSHVIDLEPEKQNTETLTAEQTEESPETSAAVTTRTTRSASKSKSRSRSPKEMMKEVPKAAMDTPTETEKPIVQKPKKFRASTVDIGLEDSADESDDEVVPVPVPVKKAVFKAKPKKLPPVKNQKPQKGGKKRNKAGQSCENDIEIIDGDIPTPSEDSLTSSDEETEKRTGAYDFVFEHDFNYDPRRDGNAEKDKLFNFDWMIDMDAHVNRKYERDGEYALRSDDSNSELDSDESACAAEDIKIRRSVQRKVRQFLKKKPSKKDSVEVIPTGKESGDIIIDENLTTVKTNKKISKSSENDSDSLPDVEVAVDEEIEKLFDGMGSLSTDDRMFEGFLFRRDADAASRPTLQRDPDFKHHDFISNPTNVYLVYPPLGPKKKDTLLMPPNDYRVPSSDSESDKKDEDDKEDDQAILEDEVPVIAEEKMEDEVQVIGNKKLQDAVQEIAEKTEDNEVQVVSEQDEKECEPVLVDSGRATGNSTPSKTPGTTTTASEDLSTEKSPVEPMELDLHSNAPAVEPQITESSATEQVTNVCEPLTSDSPNADHEIIILETEKKEDDTLAAKYERIQKSIDGEYENNDDLDYLWEEMQSLGLHDLTEDQLHQLLASHKTSTKSKVFYDSSAKNQHHMKPDENMRKHAEKMNMDDITSMTNRQTAFEDNKVHRRRLALLNSAVTVASEFDIHLSSDDDEDDEEEDGHVEEEPASGMDDVITVLDESASGAEDTIILEDCEEDVSSSSGPVPEEREQPAQKTASPILIEIEDPVVALQKEQQIAALLFDDSEPCSSAQAAERDRILERMEEEQMIIEETIQQKLKTQSLPENVSNEPVVDDGIFKRPTTPVRGARRSKEHPEKNSPIIDKSSQGTEKNDDQDDIKLDFEMRGKRMTAYINDEIFDSSESDDSDDEFNFESKLGSLMLDVDAEVIKPSIAEYASLEYLKTAAPQANPNDIPNSIEFMSRNLDAELDMLLKTGKRTEVADDIRLEELVTKFRKDYAARNPPAPFKMIQNLDIKLAQKSSIVRSKHLMEMDLFQMKILVALQKQQIVASCASLSQPVTVTPQEHAEQVALLTNLQNPAILQPLMQKPQFEATLLQAQQQAIRQQQAQQKAIVQRELAMRKAEQARVEELARKRIAQEKIDAEPALRAQQQKTGEAGGANQLVTQQTQQSEATPNERPVDVPTHNERGVDVPIHNERSVDVPMVNERAVDVAVSGTGTKTIEAVKLRATTSEVVNTSGEQFFELDRSMSVNPQPSEPILAGNVTHTVDKTIDDEEEPRNESPNLLETTIDESMDTGECSTSRFEDETIDIDEDLLLMDEEESKKIREKDMAREMVDYANRYHGGTMSALNQKGVKKHNDDAEQLREAHELQEMMALRDAGVTTEYKPNAEEDDEEEKEKEPEFEMDQLQLAKSILKQRQGYEPFGEFDSEEDEDYDPDTCELLVKSPRLKRPPRQRANVFVPNIPIKIRRKYVEQKVETERNKLKNKLKTDKMSAIRINLPPRPPPSTAAQPQFATPKLPAHRGKHPAGPRAAPKPKKAKMANVQMSIVEPPQPLHELQNDLGAPTKITAVPNTTAAFHAAQQQALLHQQAQQAQQQAMQHQHAQNIQLAQQKAQQLLQQQAMQQHHAQQLQQAQQLVQHQVHMQAQKQAEQQAQQNAQQQPQAQQQIFSSMSQVPQSTPIRSTTATPAPVPQQQSHLAQLGQLVHGTNPQGTLQTVPQPVPQGIQQGIPQGLQLQAAQIQQIAQAAQAAQAAMLAKVRQTQTPNPAAVPSQVDLLNQLNAQMAMQVSTAQDQHQEMAAITQILQARRQFPPTDEKQFLAHFAQAQADYRAAVAEARMENIKAAQAALAREEAMKRQAQEQQRIQAAAEKKAKAKAQAEARKKAEQEQARKAKEEAKARELAQAQAQMRAQAAQAAHAAQIAHATQVAQAHQTFTEIQAVAATGQPLSTEQLQKLQQLAKMPHIVPMQDLEQIKNILLHHMVLNYRMGTPQPNMPMVPGMFPGFGAMPAPTPDQFAQLVHQPELLRQLQEATLAMGQRKAQMEQNSLLQQQQMAQQMAQQILPQGFNSQHLQLLQQQMNMQQMMALNAARGTPAPGNPAMFQPGPRQTPAPQQTSATPAPVAATPAPVTVPVPVAPAALIQTPQTIQTPQPVKPAQPEVVSTNVELEIWPSNGYTAKNNLQGPNAAALFYRTTADANLNHVACLIRSRLMCDNVSTLWVLRLEDRSVQRFRLDQNLAEAQRFVGRQHVIMFYDDAAAGEAAQTIDYIINKNFQSHTSSRQ